MRQQVILATTHVDSHNDRFTLNALEQMSEIINGETKPLVTYEHDMAIPPVGKILESRVEQREDGEFQLIATQELFEKIEWGTLEDGTRLFKQESETDRHPFTNKYDKISEEFAVSFDSVNFESQSAMQSFVREIEEQSGIKFEAGIHGRKSLIPDPEFIVQVGAVITGYLLSKKVVDKVTDKVGDQLAEDAAKFYSFVRSVVFAAAKYARPKGRPITYVFVVPGDPYIEFLARSSDPNWVANNVLLEQLQGALTNAESLRKNLGAVRVQYFLNDQAEWEFNYLLTYRGGVIGTIKSFGRRARRIELMVKEIDGQTSPVTSDNALGRLPT